MLTDQHHEDIYNQIHTHFTQVYDSLETLQGGGEIRAIRGDSTERMVDIVCEYLRTNCGVNVSSKVGDDDKQIIAIGAISRKHQVDRHVYAGDRLALIIEVKAYLDSCYYERACNDFKVMRLGHPTVKTVVLALENGISNDSVIFTDAVFDNVCDKICYLCAGKRSSARPMYRREFRKPLERQGVRQLVEAVYNSVH